MAKKSVTVLCDSNVVTKFLRKQPDVLAELDAIGPARLAISIIQWFLPNFERSEKSVESPVLRSFRPAEGWGGIQTKDSSPAFGGSE